MEVAGLKHCWLHIAAVFGDAVCPTCGAVAFPATTRDAHWSARRSAVLVRVRLVMCWAVAAASSSVLSTSGCAKPMAATKNISILMTRTGLFHEVCAI